MDEIRKLIEDATAKARIETNDEPEPSFTGTTDFPVTCQVGKGLEGAIASETSVGYVNGAKGWLVYRGYDCFDLAGHSTFEETCYLLLNGRLPNSREYDSFRQILSENRSVPTVVLDTLAQLPIAEMHPMSALRTAVSLLGNLDPREDDTSVENETRIAIELIAQFPTLIGAIARLRNGEKPVAPKPEHSLAEGLLYAMNGTEPSAHLAHIMDIALILHADHGLNASTFTSLVVNSSLSDFYGTTTAALASLKGPLHGGANEAVLYDLEEIGSPDNVAEWFRNARTSKRKIMGFGHRVYKAYDPRARLLGPMSEYLSKDDPTTANLYRIAYELEKTVVAELGKDKKIFPNVDFYSGIVYRAMGIETSMFTPIFAASRIAGWAARTLEYLADNRIFRPRAVYDGPISENYRPIEER